MSLLTRAVKSIEQQDVPCEIVIVDNVSANPIRPEDFETASSVRVFRNERPLTAAKNRNIGIQRSTGDVVCFLDDDDEYLPGKFESVLKVLSQNAELDYVYAATQMIGPEGKFLGRAGGVCDLNAFLRWRFMHCNSMAVRRRVFEILMFNEDMGTYEDTEFAGRLMRGFKGQRIEEDHAIWYRDGRADQLTSRNYRRAKNNWAILCDVFEDEIRADPALRRFYYDKMIKLCLMFGDLRGTKKYLSKRLAKG